LEAGKIADFAGLRVLSLESRRADSMEQAILHHGGRPFVAPSVKEIPLKQHTVIFQWAERLFAGDFDLIVFMTGAGLSFLRDILSTRYPIDAFPRGLRALTTVARGPKPTAVLQEMGLRATVMVPEPNTWQEIAAALAARPERRITVQEYGRDNPELVAALRAFGLDVTPLSVYRWTLPDDQGPLREAARRIAARECDVVLFTTSIQLTHLLEVAEAMGCSGEVRGALEQDIAVASVGPVMTAALEECGLTPDMVPPHPKMPLLVRSAAEEAAAILARKRRGTTPRRQTCRDTVIR
jgi:uroporphyrinogen-III synthase